ncbi:MAG: phosphoenolpyruvate synthase [Deltaproteobacteria bacterium]|nr:phosphoenolpyruvate synthase [Deltaproteobacteria bacterium]
MLLRCLWILVLTVAVSSEAFAQYPGFKEDPQKLIAMLKRSERGPFSRILWFCSDGTSHPPSAGACEKHGGGIQHGEWNEAVRGLRENGYLIATVYAALTEDEVSKLGANSQDLSSLLIERFLIERDDGWIFNRARYYRGAAQVEDEVNGSQRLLQAIYGRDEVAFLMMREAARLFPREADKERAQSIRFLATQLAKRDIRFLPLKNKLHSYPDSRDGERVRKFLRDFSPRETDPYWKLISLIEDFYLEARDGTRLRSLAASIFNGFDISAFEELELSLRFLTSTPASRWSRGQLAELLAVLRTSFESAEEVHFKSALMDASLLAEELMIFKNSETPRVLNNLTRGDALDELQNYLFSLYGIGVISSREFQSARYAVMRAKSSEFVEPYCTEIDYLSRAPIWSQNRYQKEFSHGLSRMSKLEPIAKEFVVDRLRGGVALLFSELMEQLEEDCGNLLEREHVIFDETVSHGLGRLNPGIARGILFEPVEGGAVPLVPEKYIYLVEHTTAELPPVAGILTMQEGNMLSHVQLLARNLGLPNVVVSSELMSRLKTRLGRNIVVAASPQGKVSIADYEEKWEEVFKGFRSEPSTSIDVNLNKIDLKERRLLSLRRVGQSDSGRIAGPKAANLGELKRRFPSVVTEGVVIPFGVFKAALEQIQVPDGRSIFSWMQSVYRDNLDHSLSNPVIREMLSTVREAILDYEFSPAFLGELRSVLAKELGPIGTYGVFVRSDTNVEDLANFTGAGLNLTIANVKEFKAIVDAIRQVWTSPFAERAYSWRQRNMSTPEHVYAGVLLLKSVPSEKSGVLVTADVDRGDANFFTVAANEGIGGAVSNQLAELLTIDKRTGDIRLLLSASAPTKRVLAYKGGLDEVFASKGERIMQKAELSMLIRFAEELLLSDPPLVDEAGERVPADIEFGFVGGRLQVFQVRPFLHSRHSAKNSYLMTLDSKKDGLATKRVNMDEKLLLH